jgi:hypothetical protein
VCAPSAASGVHALAASALGDSIVLWCMVGGAVHRVVNLGGRARAIAFDEDAGVWVATRTRGLFISPNGETLATTETPEEVSAIAALQLGRASSPRRALCGTVGGRIFSLAAMLATRAVDAVELPKVHSAPIVSIVIHPGKGAFVSVDADDQCFLWTAPGSGDATKPGGEVCSTCARGAAAVGPCPSCGRAICRSCAGAELRCPLCLALNVF